MDMVDFLLKFLGNKRIVADATHSNSVGRFFKQLVFLAV
jgi:hypothetical protein